MTIKTYEELMVWQEAMRLAKDVYCLQKQLPKEEVYGLGDQIRRAAVSVPSNIAEGFGRDSRADFIHFLHIARGSLFELRTQLELARRLEYLNLTDTMTTQLESVGRLLNGLITYLREHKTLSKNPKPTNPPTH